MTPFIAITTLDALLLVILVRALLPWWGKIAITIAVLAFNFTLVSSLNSYRGWPINSPVPTKSIFVSCLVTEPSIIAHERGSIYLWLLPLSYRTSALGYHPGSNEPRAYHEPYDEGLQRVCQSATKKQRGSAQPIVLARNRGGTRSSGSSMGRFHVYRLPPATPPRKGHE